MVTEISTALEEHVMASRQELQVQRKRELERKDETTIPARIFMPTADIYETPDALTVVLEMPGVERSNVDVRVEEGVLKVEGRLDLAKYRELQPLYTEYNIGHYARTFQISSKIDQSRIAAEMKDGVLSLKLPKVEEAKARTIQVR
jgi:HSP20 family molecular chaperone IbpA